jgi:hypothetical protein
VDISKPMTNARTAVALSQKMRPPGPNRKRRFAATRRYPIGSNGLMKKTRPVRANRRRPGYSSMIIRIAAAPWWVCPLRSTTWISLSMASFANGKDRSACMSRKSNACFFSERATASMNAVHMGHFPS